MVLVLALALALALALVLALALALVLATSSFFLIYVRSYHFISPFSIRVNTLCFCVIDFCMVIELVTA